MSDGVGWGTARNETADIDRSSRSDRLPDATRPDLSAVCESEPFRSEICEFSPTDFPAGPASNQPRAQPNPIAKAVMVIEAV